MWELLWDYDPNGLLVVDTDLKITVVNQALCAMFKTAPERVIGQPVSTLVDDLVWANLVGRGYMHVAFTRDTVTASHRFITTVLSRDYEEKRDFIRMQMDCQAHCTDQRTGERFVGRAIDLSGKGLCLELDRSLPPGTLLEVVIEPQKAVGRLPLGESCALLPRARSSTPAGCPPRHRCR